MSGFESDLTALPKYVHKKMAPSNSKKESRRSSILKPYKPPQQLENSSCNKSPPKSPPKSPIERKVRNRRVSFAEKKHIKKFCSSNEQGTVWDSTYEEHDTSFKSSSITDSNVETELKENTSECNENDYKYTTFESGPHCSKNLNLTRSNQPSTTESTTEFNEETNDLNNMCDLNCINPIECTESSDKEAQLERTSLSCQNKSTISLCTSIVSNNPILEKSIIMDTNMDEECMQLSHLRHEQTAKVSNVNKYKDSNEKNCTSEADNKYSNSYNKNSESNNKTLYAQNLSMESTIAISKSLLPSCSYTREQKSMQKNDKISRSNLDTIADCNNAKSASSVLRTSCENTKCHTTNNYDTETFSSNLQSNIASKNIGSKQYYTDNTASNKKENVNDLSRFNEKTRLSHRSMEFTKAVPISSYKEKTFHINDSTHSIQGENKIDETELCKDLPRTNICDKEDLGINKEPIFGGNKSEVVSSKNKEEITDIITCKTSKKNSHKKKSMNESSRFNEKTKLLYKSMDFTEVIPVSSYRERTFHIVDSTHSTQEKNKIDETELCKDLPIERTNICNEEDLGINKEPIFEGNKSEVASSKNKEEITDIITCKTSKKNSHKEKNVNESSCFNEKTKSLHGIYQRSMEDPFTKAIPVSSFKEEKPNIVHSNVERIQGITHEKSKNDAIKFCNNLSEMTNVCNKETLRIDEPTLKDNGSMISHDVSTEMTKQVISKNQEEIPVASESICKNNSGKKEDMIDSINLNENNKLLHKSMESIETISILPCSERTLNTTAQSSALSQAMLSRTQFPTKSSIDLACQNNTDTNKTIPNILMETLAASHLTTTSQLHESVNETKNEENAFPNITTNNATESRKNLTEKDSKIPKEIIETADIDKKFSDDIESCLNNSNLSTNTGKGTGIKRKSEENDSISKKIHISIAESQSSQENNIHSLSLTNNDNMRNVEHDEPLAKNTINYAQASEPNCRDNLNDINECSFLRKSLPYLENDCVELQSIKPPSFVCLDSEENSFLSILEELETISTVDDAAINNNHNNNSDRLTTIIRKSECLVESKKDVTQDHENLKEISKEKEKSINIENDQTEHCLKNISRHNDRSEDQEMIDCPTTKVTVTNDSQNNKSNCCRIDVEEHNRESISIINHEESIPKTNEDQVAEKKCIKEKTNEDQVAEKKYIEEKTNDVKLKNNIENEERQLNEKESLEKEQCVDHLKERKTITEDPVDSETRCEQSSNDKIKEQRMEQEEKFADKKSETEQCVNVNEDKSLQDTLSQKFLLLFQKLEAHAKSDDCIWDIYQMNIDKNMIAFGFIAKSLLIVTYFSNQNSSEEFSITKIKVISRVADSSGVHIKIVHKVILEKVNTEILTQLYRSQEDVFPMLDLVSQEVKLAMDFMFDLKRLDDLNLMDITCDEISFVSRSKQMDVIIRVTIKVKRFDKLTTNDVSVQCLLGIIRETDVKSLIISIKKDHLFLRRYMNDIKSYVDIMEETPIK